MALQDRIAKLAFSLFEARGCEHGFDCQDWFEAERIIANEDADNRSAVEADSGEFSFRFRVNVAPRSGIMAASKTIPLLKVSDHQSIEIVGDPSISNSSWLVVRAHGWRSADEAEKSGKRFADIFTLTLVKNRVGAELWPRRGGGMFTVAGLQMLEAQTGRRMLNDKLGLTVYETHPRPQFVSTGGIAKVSSSPELVVNTFRSLAAVDPQLTDRERVSIDLFNASFFEPASDTRLITLVMAIEALLEPPPRPPQSVELVDRFMAEVKNSVLAEEERASLFGGLRWLRTQSIRSTGRRLCELRLGSKTYNNFPAAKFFLDCYELRSQLVHGSDIRFAREEAGGVVAQLEVMVSDLIMSRFAVV